MKKIRHVLIVTPSFPENDQQGIIVPPLQLYLREIRDKYPTILISVVSIHFPFNASNYLWNGIHVYPLNARNGALFMRPFYWLKGLLKMKKIHALETVDLVHSFWYNEATFLAQQFSTIFHVPHFATFMGQDAKESNKYHRTIRSKKVVKISLSQFQKEVFEHHSNQSIDEVIPFGISTFDKELNMEPLIIEPIELICVSSLIELKRVTIFIDLVARLKQDFPNIKAEVVGEGKLHADLTTQIKRLGLDGNVLLRGKLSREKCLARMRQAKILIHTSSYEGQGYVLNEALALGCNVITLSKSLIIVDDNYAIVEDTDELYLKSKEALLKDSNSRKVSIPIKMGDTLLAYEQLFQKAGITF